MPKTTFDEHIAALRAGQITKRNVIGLRKALNADARRHHGWSTSQTAPKAAPEQIEAALEIITGKAPPVVAGELHTSGVAQLQSRRYRKQLEHVADIVANVARFRLVDFEMRGRYGEYAVPVYRAETDDGRAFDFVNVPWQSGGRGPEVVRT